MWYFLTVALKIGQIKIDGLLNRSKNVLLCHCSHLQIFLKFAAELIFICYVCIYKQNEML